MKKIILCFIIIISSINSYSMLDSLKGYGDFRFGQTKFEIINELNIKKIPYDTLKKFLYSNEDVINYKDKIKIDFVDYNIYIRLYFDKFNNYKLYEAEIEIQKNCEDLDKALLISENFLDIYVNKYGYFSKEGDFMDSMYFIGGCIPKTKLYEWNLSNGSIYLRFDYQNFFKKIDLNDYDKIKELKDIILPIYTNEPEKNKLLEIHCSYYHSKLLGIYMHNKSIEYQKRETEKKKELENKF